MKFGQMVRVTKKMTMTYNRAKPQSRNGETAVFALGPKSQNGPKIHFFQWDPGFFQKTIGAYGHGLLIGVGPVPKSFSVSDLGHFS